MDPAAAAIVTFLHKPLSTPEQQLTYKRIRKLQFENESNEALKGVWITNEKAKCQSEVGKSVALLYEAAQSAAAAAPDHVMDVLHKKAVSLSSEKM